MLNCPCGLPNPYLACCGLYIEELHHAPTPEKLMRSRYTAYTLANMAYIKATMRGKALLNFDEADAAHWAKQVKWTGLKIINTFPKATKKECGFVEFMAFYEQNEIKHTLSEKSEFHYLNEQWFYTDSLKPSASRNTPCPCGSHKKYKNCHGREN